MPLIEVNRADADRLNRVVPRHLKGPTMLTRQIQWAIDELFSRISEKGNGEHEQVEQRATT